MKKVVAALVVLFLLMVVPFLGIALLVSSSAAANEAIPRDCSSAPMLATGSWRPPFQEAYSVVSSSAAGAVLKAQGQGPAKVVTLAAGTVIQVATTSQGSQVVVQHDGGVVASYGGVAAVSPAPAKGAKVRAGQVIGVVGPAGAAIPQLLLSVSVGGAAVDPVAFMLEHGAPLNGQTVAPSSQVGANVPVKPGDGGEGGIGFPLPAPAGARNNSLTNPPLPIPGDIEAMYKKAGAAYNVPWTLLAGIGMEESGHGRNNTTSSAGALGLMQFMPATFASMGVDGDGDGRADIGNSADSIMSAAHYLTVEGVSRGGQEGVRKALWAYNHADWYVNDVLFYAAAYGGGMVLGDPAGCGAGGAGDPNLPPLTNDRVRTALSWALAQVGKPYVLGANGPDAYDCSSFTQIALAQVGIAMPRTAQAQRDWLAAGNGLRVPAGQEQPGDLIFTDTYLGPATIGHVMVVLDPAAHKTIEAGGDRVGSYSWDWAAGHAVFEVWRVGNLAAR